MNLTLLRNLETDYCTGGLLAVESRGQWPTIERAWVANTGGGVAGAPGKSRIPAGRYRIERHQSEAHPKSWALVAPLLGVWHWPWDIPKDVKEGRSTILIHPANYAHELAGCIAPGKTTSKGDGGRWGVFRSRDAMNEVNQLLTGMVDVWIDITDPQPRGLTTGEAS